MTQKNVCSLNRGQIKPRFSVERRTAHFSDFACHGSRGLRGGGPQRRALGGGESKGTIPDGFRKETLRTI